jgi:hypothetical protein
MANDEPALETVWAGRGNGRPCNACDRPITAEQLEYEVEGPERALRFHRECFTALTQHTGTP